MEFPAWYSVRDATLARPMNGESNYLRCSVFIDHCFGARMLVQNHRLWILMSDFICSVAMRLIILTKSRRRFKCYTSGFNRILDVAKVFLSLAFYVYF